MKKLALAITLIFVFAICPAFADGVDLSKLSLNGVAPGNSAAQVRQALGRPSQVKGSKGQFLLYRKGAWSRLTVELGDDKHVTFVQNGSSLSLGGRVILNVGDKKSRIDSALANTPHETREKIDSWDFVYMQSDRMLVIVVKNNRVADIMLGAKKY